MLGENEWTLEMAHELDPYDPPRKTRSRLRKVASRLLTTPWTELTSREMDFRDGLIYLSPNGMRYFLPALLRWRIEEHPDDCEQPEVHHSVLVALDSGPGEKRFRRLDARQRACVVRFLEFLIDFATQEIEEWERVDWALEKWACGMEKS